MTDAGAMPGFFGKVPAVGDFVSRRLPRDFLDPWDEWLQAALACSRQQMGETWLDAYLTSPVWRFALSEGVAGPLPCSGILMPSVDKAGRYFPITVATFLPANTNLFGLAEAVQTWYVGAEEVALSVLGEIPPNIEALDSAVIGLGRLGSVPESEHNKTTLDGESADLKSMHISMSSIDNVNDALLSMLERFSASQFGTYSLWWGMGSEQIAPAMMLCDGLPSIDGYSAMLCGEWQEYGWDNLSGIQVATNNGSANELSL